MLRKILTLTSMTLVAALFSLTALAAKLNINTADAEALADGIVGVGPKTAVAIVEYRQQHGPFESVAALEQVSGVGPKILEKNKDRLTIKASSD